MRQEIKAKDLPLYAGKTIYLHDEESGREEVLVDIQLKDGWVQGRSKNSANVCIGLNYHLTKIFVDT